eukprot:11494138-Ditylum_brightwellii.AAC.1
MLKEKDKQIIFLEEENKLLWAEHDAEASNGNARAKEFEFEIISILCNDKTSNVNRSEGSLTSKGEQCEQGVTSGGGLQEVKISDGNHSEGILSSKGDWFECGVASGGGPQEAKISDGNQPEGSLAFNGDWFE